jgi:hypothetical protein
MWVQGRNRQDIIMKEELWMTELNEKWKSNNLTLYETESTFDGNLEVDGVVWLGILATKMMGQNVGILSVKGKWDIQVEV